MKLVTLLSAAALMTTALAAGESRAQSSLARSTCSMMSRTQPCPPANSET